MTSLEVNILNGRFLILIWKATGEELVEEELSELQEALALIKEEDNSLELTTLIDLLLGDLKKS